MNHGQTLERLAERGGLSWDETCAVLENRPWSRMGEIEAKRRVLEIVNKNFVGSCNMKNRLYSVEVENENHIGTNHKFNVYLEFTKPICEKDARNWLQRVIADATHSDFEIASDNEDLRREK